MATPEMLQPTVQLIELEQDQHHLLKGNKFGIRQDVSSIFGKKYKPKIIISSSGMAQGGEGEATRPFACMFCPAAFKSEAALVSHVRVHVNASGVANGVPGGKQIVHSCVYCNRSFKQATNLEIHMRTYHPYGDGSSASPQQLNYPGMNQAASYMMNQAGLALWEYKNQEQLQTLSQQQGDGGEPSEGQTSEPNSSHEHSIVVVKAEKGQQEFATPDASGGTVSWEKVSPRDIQAYQVERPHQCPYCIKSFKQQTHLKQHLRIHSDEKPYECTYCGRRFRQKAVLNQHVRLHTGERPYVCVQCGNTFRQLTNLKSHLNTCTGQSQAYLGGQLIWGDKSGENAAPGGPTKPKRGRRSKPQNQYIKLEEGMEANEKVSQWLRSEQSHRLFQDQSTTEHEDNAEAPSSSSKSLWARAMSLDTACKSLQQHWNTSGGGKDIGNTISGVALWEHSRAMQQQQQASETS